jgi:hypothetical protein
LFAQPGRQEVFRLRARLLLFCIDLEKDELLSKRRGRLEEVDTETTFEEKEHGTGFSDTHPR